MWGGGRYTARPAGRQRFHSFTTERDRPKTRRLGLPSRTNAGEVTSSWAGRFGSTRAVMDGGKTDETARARSPCHDPHEPWSSSPHIRRAPCCSRLVLLRIPPYPLVALFERCNAASAGQDVAAGTHCAKTVAHHPPRSSHRSGRCNIICILCHKASRCLDLSPGLLHLSGLNLNAPQGQALRPSHHQTMNP